MAQQEATDPVEFFKDFEAIVDVDYKHVNGVGIPASIFIPKNLKAGKTPVIVRWHGGGFCTGYRSYADWTATWFINFALSHNAIIISPDYRLLPEATGLDVLQDVQDFFSWLFTPGKLAAHLPSQITPDLDHILSAGESAGGWHALQAGLLHPDKISAIATAYPMIDLRDKFFTTYYEKHVFDPPVPQLPPSMLYDHIATLKGGEVVPSRSPPDGLPFMAIMMQQGLYAKLFGTDTKLHILEVLDDNVKAFPPTWVLHGSKDSAVPVQGTEKFVEKLKSVLPKSEVKATYVEGGDHGFDGRADGTWREEGTGWVEQFWPVKK